MVLRKLAIIVFVIATVDCYKLNVPKVLLPYHAVQSSPPINFTLEITDIDDASAACFQWKSSRPEVAAVHPAYDERGFTGRKCASRAVVSAVSQQSSRRTAIVSAEDIHTGTVLRCDVIVDSLHSLEIVTTTKQLYLEDSPELFIVRAKNIEGDTFADLDGLSFEWKVESAAKDPHRVDTADHYVTASQPARIVSFTDSEYETTAAIQHLEAEGLRGDRILVEGRSTGVALISVRSRDEPYRTTIPSCSIQLTVMAFLTLEPSADLRVPVGSRIRYSLKLIRYRKAETIALPSPQYHIYVETIEPQSTVEVARFDETTAIFEALAIGTVRLAVSDRKLDISVAKYDLPSSYVYVVEPAAILFTVSTGIWVFEVGRSYEVNVQLTDSDGRVLFMAENTIMDVVFPSGLVRATQLSDKNQTVWLLNALEQGADSIEATYDSFLDADGGRRKVEHVIRGSRPLEIFTPMSITPPIVVFPPCYESSIASDGLDPCFQRRLFVRGGSGHFVWTIDAQNYSAPTKAKVRLQTVEDRIATVSTLEGDPMVASIVAADGKNRLHKASSTVIVANPVKAEFVVGPREVEVGETLRLGLRVYGKIQRSAEQEIPFTDCSRMSFDIRLSNEHSLVAMKDELIQKQVPGEEKEGGACVSLPFLAQAVGDVTVTLNLWPRGSSSHGAIITATVGISVYATLKLLSPVGNELLLTPTSSYAAVFSGGPRPLLVEPSAHFVSVERLGKTGTSYFETSSVTETTVAENENSTAYAFTVSCVSGTPVPTTASLLISVGNKNTSTNPFPALSSMKMNVICDFPTSLSLEVKRKAASGDHNLELPPCPLDGRGSTTAIPVYVGENFDVLATLLDRDGRRFDNASALEYTWRVIDASLLRPPSNRAHSLHWRAWPKFGGTYEFYETFQPNGREGVTKITAEVVGIASDACLSETRKACEEFMKRSLKASIMVKLLSYATLVPSAVVLYSDPRSRALIAVRGGSGHFVVSMEDEEKSIISWTISDRGQKIELKPTGIGLGETVLNIYDTCLLESPPARANVAVASIEKLVLNGPSLVMLGERLKLRVSAFDALDRQLSVEDIFKFLTLDVQVEGTGLTRQPNSESATGSLSFDTPAVGASSVIASINDINSGRIIRSLPHRVQVFPALRLEPQSISLIAGARFQLRITGGLQHSPSSWFVDPSSSGVSFSVNDSKIVSIGVDGLMEAKRPGRVAVMARLANPEKANEILAEDMALVHVVQLASVRVFSPVTTVYAGSTVPLNFIGHKSYEPSSYFDTMNSGDVVFPWGTASADLPLKATWIVEGDGAVLDSPPADSVSGTVRLKCVHPGVVHVRLSIEQPSVEMAKLQFASGIGHHRRGAQLNASVAITVITEMRFAETSPCRHSGALPHRLILGHNSTHVLQFTEQLRNYEYKTYGSKTSSVQVTPDGTIRSSDTSGDATIVGTGARMDASDVQEMAAFVVSVRPVAYLLASSQHWSVWRKGWPVDAFPVLYTLKFALNYYDSRGLRFDAVQRPGKLEFRPNRFDLAEVAAYTEGDDAILVVRLKAVGETVIKLWDVDNPASVVQYLLINAIHAIEPSSPVLQIGRSICFTNTMSGSSGDAVWSSSDPAVLAVDSASGMAAARKPGQSIISHTLSGAGDEKFTTTTLVTVTEPASISIVKEKGLELFTDADDDTEHVFSVTFHGDGESTLQDCVIETKIQSLFTDQPASHSCGIQISPALGGTAVANLFFVDASYEPSFGFVCVVKRVTPSSTSPTSVVDSVRNVTVWASRGSLVSDRLMYPLYPSLVVQPVAEILIDNERMSKATVRVMAPYTERLDRLKVTLSADARNLFVTESLISPKSESGQQPDAMAKKEYTVRLRNDAVVVDAAALGARKMDLHVLLTDGLTGFVRQLPIRLSLRVKLSATDDEKAAGIVGFLWNLLIGAKDVYGTIVVIVVSVALTIVSVYFGFRFMLVAASRIRDTKMVSEFTPVSPASIPWRSYGGGMRSPHLWSMDRSQSPPSPERSARQQTPDSILSRRRM